MNPSVDVGNPPRPFRHLRMAERCTPDPSSSRAPVHSALVQKSVTAITNPAGRLSVVMLGEPPHIGKSQLANSWQTTCIQSNEAIEFQLAIQSNRLADSHRKIVETLPATSRPAPLANAAFRTTQLSVTSLPPPNNCSSPAHSYPPDSAASLATRAIPYAAFSVQCSTNIGNVNDC